jgi:acyl dehydratase
MPGTLIDVPPRLLSVTELKGLVGHELGVSDWHIVGQDQIDAFAEITGDDQFIHVDPVRAAATQFGGTIAHGFLTLSLLSAMGREALPLIKGRTMGINYGFDQVRFLSPVKSGARVRGHFALAGLDDRGKGQILLRYKVNIEIEGEAKRALAAEWLAMAVIGDASAARPA